MNGPHDLGGHMGFGSIVAEDKEPVFHAEWERRALGLMLCAGAMGHWTVDESRQAFESLHPAHYYAASYYEIWINGLEKLLVRHGFVTMAELTWGDMLEQGARPKRILRREDVAGELANGGLCNRPVRKAPSFEPGQLVRTKNFHPVGHTRLPRYTRDKLARVEAVRDVFVLPDTNAHGLGENPEWVYTVVFNASELWGKDADPSVCVSIDVWESYLDAA